ncbi:hypothetical protein BCL57_000158 [Agromyces flavus]|uniref:Lipoprotein n=1 Tax=Agromyces flavus TaxID=589382 RepID=A0A1H1VUM4_9MICO|nr:hypothetical protein [Agromyces flavus]MCP2366016.1 hypothetical protein [Agromyces flavus]GGI43831.1 hypothetical protein GCM10010932_01560 [Agromyces flavus]SDS88597.1 hypothetical protein SAMN04489721_2089 [Agromyces flavus]
MRAPQSHSSGPARRAAVRAAVAAPAAVAAAVLALSACTAGTPAASPSAGDLPQGGETVELDPAEFSADIDHPYWPMEPGTQWEYRELDGDGETLRVVVTATTDTREIANGVTARVVRDTVYQGDEIVEDTFDWYAQRDDGSVWYLGEDTAEFEDGEIATTEGSFEAGVDGAQAGVLLPADPKPGQSYRQEYLEGEAEDEGEVLRVGERAEAPYGAYDDVLVTRDTNALEPDVVEYKFYARDLGPLLALDVAGGSGREELVDVRTVPDGTGTGPLGDPG